MAGWIARGRRAPPQPPQPPQPHLHRHRQRSPPPSAPRPAANVVLDPLAQPSRAAAPSASSAEFRRDQGRIPRDDPRADGTVGPAGGQLTVRVARNAAPDAGEQRCSRLQRATLLQTPDVRGSSSTRGERASAIRRKCRGPSFPSRGRIFPPNLPASPTLPCPPGFPSPPCNRDRRASLPPPAVLSASVQPHLTPTSTWPLAGERRIIYIDRTSPSLARPATTHTKISTICALSHSAAAEPRGAFPHDEHGHRGCIPGRHVSVRGSSFHLRTQPGTSEERTNKKKKGESENRKTEKRSARRKEGNPAVFIRLTASTTCRYDSTHAPTRSQETSACIAKSGLSCSRPWTWEAAEPGGGGPRMAGSGVRKHNLATSFGTSASRLSEQDRCARHDVLYILSTIVYLIDRENWIDISSSPYLHMIGSSAFTITVTILDRFPVGSKSPALLSSNFSRITPCLSTCA